MSKTENWQNEQNEKVLEVKLRERQKDLRDLRFERAACKGQAAGDEIDACYWIERERILISEIQSLDEQLQLVRCSRLQSAIADDDAIRLGSIVKIQMMYEDGSVEELEVKIITFGSLSMKDSTSYSQITDNSPIGKAIIGKRVGDILPVKLPEENANVAILAIN